MWFLCVWRYEKGIGMNLRKRKWDDEVELLSDCDLLFWLCFVKWYVWYYCYEDKMSDCVKCWRMRLDMIEFDDILLGEYGWRMRDEILFVFCWITQQQQGLWKQNKNVISFSFQFQNKQQELCGVMKVRNGEFVCGYCFNTLTNPLKLPCGYDLCEECVLEGWGEEEINWEREIRELNEGGECEGIVKNDI